MPLKIDGLQKAPDDVGSRSLVMCSDGSSCVQHGCLRFVHDSGSSYVSQRILISPSNILPVDHIPYALQIICTYVFILQPQIKKRLKEPKKYQRGF